MKKRRTGYILNVSAVLACEPVPFFGVYSATKAFVTNFSIALYQEMKRFNVVVSCLHPPATATAFGQEAEILDSRALQLFNLLHSTLSAEQVARAGLRGLAARRPSVVAGLLGKVIYASAAFTPRFLGLWLMEFLFKTKQAAHSPNGFEKYLRPKGCGAFNKLRHHGQAFSTCLERQILFKTHMFTTQGAIS